MREKRVRNQLNQQQEHEAHKDNKDSPFEDKHKFMECIRQKEEAVGMDLMTMACFNLTTTALIETLNSSRTRQIVTKSKISGLEL